MYFKAWLDKANNDLLAAEAILAYYEEPPTDTICYHDAKYPPGFPVLYPIDEAKIAVDQAREILAFTREKLTTEQPETSA
jgi:hypothetical protein